LKKRFELFLVLFVVSSFLLSTGLMLSQYSKSDYSTTMKSAKLVITTVTVVTDLPDGAYTLKIGLKWKRILGSYWSDFQTSDSQYEDTGMEWVTYPNTIWGGPDSAGTTYTTDKSTAWCYTVELDESGYEYYVSFKLQKVLSETKSFWLGSSDNDYDVYYETCNVWYGKFGAYLKFEYKFVLYV